jgi:hypothetical protein
MVTARDSAGQEQVKTEDPYGVSVSSNGMLVPGVHRGRWTAQSADGAYWCRYTVTGAGDEVRELTGFRFYHGDTLLFRLEEVPGSDIVISSQGWIAFLDLRRHFQDRVEVYFYGPDGHFLFSRIFHEARGMAFSAGGNTFAVSGGVRSLTLISLPSGRERIYPGGLEFAVSEDESLTVVAGLENVRVYNQRSCFLELPADSYICRGVAVSSRLAMIAVIDRSRLRVYRLPDGKMLYGKVLNRGDRFRDVTFRGDVIVAGVHRKEKGESLGIRKIFDWTGNCLDERITARRTIPVYNGPKRAPAKSGESGTIPWPFAPFDSMRTVWNGYEQHMAPNDDFSYLHQGLDLITPTNEPTYAVEAGVVKCVLTIAQYYHWRVAVSPEHGEGWGNGWLYAHLVPHTIQHDVGDTVSVHDYLGDIIEWGPNWGHIHFVEIHDSGRVWLYSDNEWGINFNPLLTLRPLEESDPPVIVPVFETSKFAFCVNESSVYLNPDSLYGDVDIVVQTADYIGDSPWTQPAYKIFYRITRISDGEEIVPRTLGFVRNHPYPFYGSAKYEPYALVMYKRDHVLYPSYWMDTYRNYHHVLTNSDGDDLISLDEKDLALATGDYPDGSYRVVVEVQDELGNAAMDSMDVRFRNSSTGVENAREARPSPPVFENPFPNPFNGQAVLTYRLPERSFVRLTVFDVLGREMARIVNEVQNAGVHNALLRPDGWGNGLYLFLLETGDGRLWQKGLYVK